jgi:hypothetical protein
MLRSGCWFARHREADSAAASRWCVVWSACLSASQPRGFPVRERGSFHWKWLRRLTAPASRKADHCRTECGASLADPVNEIEQRETS